MSYKVKFYSEWFNIENKMIKSSLVILFKIKKENKKLMKYLDWEAYKYTYVL